MLLKYEICENRLIYNKKGTQNGQNNIYVFKKKGTNLSNDFFKKNLVETNVENNIVMKFPFCYDRMQSWFCWIEL